MTRPHEDHREDRTIYRATVIDLVSHEQIGRFTYSARSLEHARERGWRLAGSRFASDIDVRIEQISK